MVLFVPQEAISLALNFSLLNFSLTVPWTLTYPYSVSEKLIPNSQSYTWGTGEREQGLEAGGQV